MAVKISTLHSTFPQEILKPKTKQNCAARANTNVVLTREGFDALQHFTLGVHQLFDEIRDIFSLIIVLWTAIESRGESDAENDTLTIIGEEGREYIPFDGAAANVISDAYRKLRSIDKRYDQLEFELGYNAHDLETNLREKGLIVGNPNRKPHAGRPHRQRRADSPAAMPR